MILITIIVFFILLIIGKYTQGNNYREGYTACGTGQLTINEQCYNCPPYAYYDTNLAECVKCNVGYYMADGKCNKCEQGSVSSAGSERCNQCIAGTYSTPDNTSCSDCPAGTYSTDGSSSCKPCPDGTYSSEHSSKCRQCPAGTMSVSGGAMCKTCPTGTYSTIGSSSCKPCPDGQTSPQGSTNVWQCQPPVVCTGNTIMINGRCSACVQGYVPNDDRTACVCPPGKAPNSNRTYCIKSCGPGYYNSPFYYGDVCMPCNAGQASNISGAESCSICPAGTYSASKATSCTPCPLGYHGPDKASNICYKCGYGQYTDIIGQTTCKTCPAGKTTSTDIAKSINDCNVTVDPNYVSCEAGMYYDSLSGQCRSCSTGYYTPSSGYMSCLQCPAGKTSWAFKPTSCY